MLRSATLRSSAVCSLRHALLAVFVPAFFAPLVGSAQQIQPEPVLAGPTEETAATTACRPWGGFWRKHVNDMQWLGTRAADAVVTAKHLQARNGEILAHTLWNHNFESQNAKLHPSGVALLNRLARNQPAEMPLDVFLATAHDFDLSYTPDDPAGFVTQRETLDAQRAKTVRDYLRLVLRRENDRVLIHDPKPVGRWSEEARFAYRRLLQSAGTAAPGTSPAGDSSGSGFGDSSGSGFGGSLSSPGGGSMNFGGGMPAGGTSSDFGLPGAVSDSPGILPDSGAGDFSAGMDGKVFVPDETPPPAVEGEMPIPADEPTLPNTSGETDPLPPVVPE
jgi:hypothetical protein